jgi:hypothetical protein
MAALFAATIAADAAAGAADELAAPGRLAIYYGIPSLVNGAGGSVEHAAAVFGGYDVVVFGAGLQHPSSTERRPTAAIIARLAATRPSTRVFGYIPLGDASALPLAAVAEAIAQWKAMGVHGIFLDEAGFDFGVTPARQSAAVDAVHRAGLTAFVNAWQPDDVFGAASRLRTGDLYLLESFLVKNSRLDDAAHWFARAERAAAHSRTRGVQVWTVTTTVAAAPFDPELCALAWWGTALWGFHGFGWGEPDFSAPSSQLPARACAAALPNGVFTGPVERAGARFTRPARAGRVEVDLERRRGRFDPAPRRPPGTARGTGPG